MLGKRAAGRRVSPDSSIIAHLPAKEDTFWEQLQTKHRTHRRKFRQPLQRLRVLRAAPEIRRPAAVSRKIYVQRIRYVHQKSRPADRLSKMERRGLPKLVNRISSDDIRYQIIGPHVLKFTR